MSGQLALLDARECGFNEASWAAAADAIIDRRINETPSLDVAYASPVDLLHEVSGEYGVMLKGDETTVVWNSICTLSHVRTSAGYGDFDPGMPLSDMLHAIMEDTHQIQQHNKDEM